MKRVAVLLSAGLALAIVIAAQALKAPEREPVVPIELPAPATRSDDEPGKTPAGEKQSRNGTTSGPATPRRQAPVTQAPPSNPPASADDGQPLSPAPEHSPPPATGRDDGDDDPPDDDDSSGENDDDADDDSADDD